MDSTRLVGRDPELALLREQLDRARAGEARIVFVRGEAGIGKTALARALVTSTSDVAVLAAAGEETETTLGLGVVDQLLSRSGARDPAPNAALTAGAELVAVVSDLAARKLVLLWVDDVHWVDPASQQALLFALRRLSGRHVCAILGFRTLDDPAIATGFRRLHREPHTIDLPLTGLDVQGVRDLARLAGVDLPPGAVRRLHEHTSGNPLWSGALLKELSIRDLSTLTSELPAPEELRRVVLSLLERGPLETRRLVEASAVAGSDWPLGTLADAAGVGQAAEALSDGVRAGLVTESPGSPPNVRTSHALIRAAVLSSLSTPRRLELHTRLGERATTARQRLSHLIAASPGTDGVLAEAAGAAAAEAASRGDLVGATELFASAARLAVDPGRRGDLLDEATTTSLLSGDFHRARSLVGLLSDLEQTPRRLLLGAWFAVSEGRHREAESRLRTTLARAQEQTDDSILPEASRLMAHLLLLGGREVEAVEHAQRAVDLETPGTIGAGMARAELVTSLAVLGRHDEAETAAAIEGPPRPDQLITAVCRGNARIYVGDWEGATDDLTAVLEASRHVGISDFLSAAWASLAKLRVLTGDWDAAIHDAQRAVEVTLDTDQVWALSPVHSTAALVPALRGDWQTARFHVDAALAAARTNRDEMSIRYAGTAAAVLAHSRGRPDEVIASVEPVLESHRGSMPAQPGMLEWPVLYAEALARTGRREDAGRVLDELDALQARTWVTSAVARVRGLLYTLEGAPEEALHAFDRAESEAISTGLPHNLALTRLERSGAAAQLGRHHQALSDVKAALRDLVALGARPHVVVAERWLATLGAPPVARASPPGPGLTPQEIAVSRLVRKGLSNREIASELFLSTKTVEFHLSHVFLKLGITSRTQLVARSAELLELHPVEDGGDRPLRAVQDE